MFLKGVGLENSDNTLHNKPNICICVFTFHWLCCPMHGLTWLTGSIDWGGGKRACEISATQIPPAILCQHSSAMSHTNTTIEYDDSSSLLKTAIYAKYQFHDI